MTREKKQLNMETWQNEKILKIIRKEITKILIKKCINAPIIQIRFMYILKISATKTITISFKMMVKITDRNITM